MAQIQVNVSWRDIPVFEDVLLNDVEDSGAFLRTKQPLPVGTMVVVSPLSTSDVRVPARVTSVTEVVEAGSDQSQGMHVLFEAAFEQLEPFLSDGPQPLVGLEPEPAFDAATAEEHEEEEAVRPIAEVTTASEGDLPVAPAVPLEPPVEEPVKDSALTPFASGEIDISGHGGKRGDPDAPDKVIVEVEAGLPPAGTEGGEERAAFEAAKTEIDISTNSDETPAEDVDKSEPKRKKRRKSRRRKKKK